jgi:hypothetical protein
MKRSFVTLYSVVLILAVHAAQAGESSNNTDRISGDLFVSGTSRC